MKLVKTHWFILLLLGIGLFSCKNQSDAEKKYEQDFDEILRIHDEVMPKMGALNSLSLALKKKIDSSSNELVKYENARKDLENSYDFMMDWMHGFTNQYVKNQPALKELSEEEIIKKHQGLKRELDEVAKMRDAVNSSMENARKLLNE